LVSREHPTYDIIKSASNITRYALLDSKEQHPRHNGREATARVVLEVFPMTTTPVDPTPIPSPEYPATYPEPETIDLTPAIEPGEPGYEPADPDTSNFARILMKIDRLIAMVDSTVAGVTA
jgi:hypothetical protein